MMAEPPVTGGTVRRCAGNAPSVTAQRQRAMTWCAGAPRVSFPVWWEGREMVCAHSQPMHLGVQAAARSCAAETARQVLGGACQHAPCTHSYAQTRARARTHACARAFRHACTYADTRTRARCTYTSSIVCVHTHPTVFRHHSRAALTVLSPAHSALRCAALRDCSLRRRSGSVGWKGCTVTVFGHRSRYVCRRPFDFEPMSAFAFKSTDYPVRRCSLGAVAHL